MLFTYFKKGVISYIPLRQLFLLSLPPKFPSLRRPLPNLVQNMLNSLPSINIIRRINFGRYGTVKLSTTSVKAGFTS